MSKLHFVAGRKVSEKLSTFAFCPAFPEVLFFCTEKTGTLDIFVGKNPVAREYAGATSELENSDGTRHICNKQATTDFVSRNTVRVFDALVHEREKTSNTELNFILSMKFFDKSIKLYG